jgi:hypothetical protein
MKFMRDPAIVAGDPNSILRLDTASMKNPSKWSQMDSDILAHFLQVHGQIAQSRWKKSKVSFKHKGDKLLDSHFPAFEDFVFVTVYFRQFTEQKDNLLNDASDRYRDFVDCPIRNAWIYEEQKRFSDLLDNNTFMLPGYKFRELFDAFLYGSLLIHNIPKVYAKHRKRFLQLCDKEPRERVLYALNGSLHHLLNHIRNIAIVIYRDFSEWLVQYSLPLPDVRWHDHLFVVPKEKYYKER